MNPVRSEPVVPRPAEGPAWLQTTFGLSFLPGVSIQELSVEEQNQTERFHREPSSSRAAELAFVGFSSKSTVLTPQASRRERLRLQPQRPLRG